MKAYEFTKKAAAELRGIRAYTLHRWGRQQAKDYILQLHEGFTRLAQHPERGWPMDHIKPGLKRYRTLHYMTYYLAAERSGRILIVRILHEKQDPATNL